MRGFLLSFFLSPDPANCVRPNVIFPHYHFRRHTILVSSQNGLISDFAIVVVRYILARVVLLIAGDAALRADIQSALRGAVYLLSAVNTFHLISVPLLFSFQLFCCFPSPFRQLHDRFPYLVAQLEYQRILYFPA